MIIWCIGLSGSGKSYLGKMLLEKIRRTHKNIFFIDGDEFREVMGNDLGYNLEDREKNGWRITKICHFLNSQGINVIASFLSNYPEHQEFNRSMAGSAYYQIYVKSDEKFLKERSLRNVYREKKNVVGMDIPFNEPLYSDKIFWNDYKKETAVQFIDEIYESIKNRLE